MLLLLIASTQVAQASTDTHRAYRSSPADTGVQNTPTTTPITIPTVAIPQSTPVSVPTVDIPQPTPTFTVTPTPKGHIKHRRHSAKHHSTRAASSQQWIWAYLTSYCPGTAGWLSSSGLPVFYGMLANDFYPFGTHVYLPVLGIIGVVEDRIGEYGLWDHFDVWSPICYSTPTGWFRVALEP